MNHYTRTFKRIAIGFICSGILSGWAYADPAYPKHAVQIIVPQSPGSVADIMARVLSKSLSKQLEQSVVVINRPGASGIIGAQAVATANPDGYTLLIGSVSTHGLLSVTEKNLSYDPVKGFEPISQINDSPLALVVNSASGINTVQDLVDKAKAEPGKLSYASAGNGSGSRFTIELLRLAGKIDMLHVPYRSPMEAVVAVASNEATLASPSVPSIPALIKSGQIRALAVTSPQRAALLPDVPTTAEAGYPSVVFTSWTGLFAPAGTPRTIIEKLNSAVGAALHDPEVIDSIESSGATPVHSSPNEFSKFVASELAKWKKAGAEAGIGPIN
ncbi:Bug family tripartite tricarboxylate transporter substrate binding protein [Paracandidimonas soli]|uniref:Tripartite-type tricarboxylate transporter receptor subunit TctC n=1 Tax=Paracandidimonas soli TaxID=1917182 RepID=A0A4R3VAA8_9BURK|nr:tripartite tricarboxylate transporter substrate binding protein [Paracandidimonas soli]TCV00703.1 tripartite-type tricarboxylate transporter receptor subunit TctC [Paracandidimonas soli]